MIWPFSAIARWMEWRRRDRMEINVATAIYQTDVSQNDGTLTGFKHTHVLTFKRDGNGVRYCELTTTKNAYADLHNAVVKDRVLWRVHGKLPDHATHCSARPTLSVINGGAE